MKRVVIFITVVLSIFASSCKPHDEKICDIFARQSVNNPETLIGEWEFEYFGYTVNGDKIKEKEKIARGGISFSESGEFSLSYWNTYFGTYAINDAKAITFTYIIVTLVGMSKEEKHIENLMMELVKFVLFVLVKQGKE